MCAAAISFHPALDHFLARFNERDYQPSGKKVGNMDGFSVGEEVVLEGAYWVCAQTTKFVASRLIHCKGPGGGLIAGNKVQLEAPEITLEGDEKDPVQIVAIESLSVKATNLKMINVVFYLFDGTKIAFDAKECEVRNVRAVQIVMHNQTVQTGDVVPLNNKKDFQDFVKGVENPSSEVEAFLERLSWEKEAASKIGLRSILLD